MTWYKNCVKKITTDFILSKCCEIVYKFKNSGSILNKFKLALWKQPSEYVVKKPKVNIAPESSCLFKRPTKIQSYVRHCVLYTSSILVLYTSSILVLFTRHRSLCTFLCFPRWAFCLNLFRHMPHMNGRSPVCVSLWAVRLDIWENTFEHSLQW